jgi:tetratricopeptide (TPR) repeat protein
MPVYDAFISYSQTKDVPIATAVQSIVQTLGKPWYRLRMLRVFRDGSSIAATPGLWGTIEQALGGTKFAILLASPEAARSEWVGQEMAFWIAHKSIDKLMIGLTSGSLAWDKAAGDFVWSDATPLPPVLKGQFKQEPRWVDLTAFRQTATRRDPKVIELAANFVAQIRNVPKEDVLSEEMRQQRRALRHAWSAAAAMFVLAVGVAWYWWEAATQRDKAESTLAATTESVNKLVIEVATKARRTIGVPVALTEDILARTRALQEKLIGSWQSNTRLERSEAIVRREIAQTHYLLGDTKAALDNALQSRVIMDRLLAHDPGNRGLRRELSRSYNRIGEAHMQSGDYAKAYEVFQHSLDIEKALTAAAPRDDAEAERDLAVSYERTADALFNLDRQLEARVMDQANFILREKLARAQPLNNEWQADLATAYDRIGARECRPDKMLDAFREALRIREALVLKEPLDATWQNDLGNNYYNIGGLLLASGQRAEAVTALRKSVEIRTRLAADRPGMVQRQIPLARSLFRLAEAGDRPKENYNLALHILLDLDAKGKLTEAHKDFRRQIEQRLAEPQTEPVAMTLPSC